MNKFQAVHVAVLAGLVIAVTLLVFQSRALTFKVQALEAERGKPAPVAPQAKTAPSNPTFDFGGPSALLEETQPRYGSKPAGSTLVETPVQVQKPATTPPAARGESDLSPAQEQAVARSVDRILEEKYGHLPKVHKPEDMEKMLERELSLTASQKERITALFAKKREESSEIFKGQNPFSGKVLQKAMELDSKYENLVKNELDATQQAKYDQLKKDGKINNGISIQIEAGGDENE